MAGDVEQLRAYVEYLRDMGVHDFYRQGEPVLAEPVASTTDVVEVEPQQLPVAEYKAPVVPVIPVIPAKPDYLEPPIPKLVSFDALAPLPEIRVAPAGKADALRAIQEEIGDCTRCPLAYAGRRTIVFGDGDPNARLMFVGEGPGADEDASGVPFVGKAGQLLNNMIKAMGLRREDVYIANIIKCRPPGNRTPERDECETCSPFLMRQISTIKPKVVVALGAVAARTLLAINAPMSELRGHWYDFRATKLAVTYHPAFLLRDPRQKKEAWKDLQMVMKELGLPTPSPAT